MLLSLTVTDNTGRSPRKFTIDGLFRTLQDIKAAIASETDIGSQFQLLLHGDRLMFGERDFLTRFNLRTFPAISLYQRLPDDKFVTVSVRSPRQREVECTLRADTPVRVLKNYLARKYCMAPWKQVLMALKAPMLETEEVGAYTITAQMEVSLSEYHTGAQPQRLRITVVEGDAKKGTFEVEQRDTVDVLLGHMEREGLVQRGEKPGLYSQRHQLEDTSKSLEDYSLRDGDVVVMVRGDK